MYYAYDIKDYECVGDVLGKINYNFITLDSLMCQLSSTYFLTENSYFKIFNEISTFSNELNFIGNTFELASIYRQCYTAVNLLSSYWNSSETTIQYPVNYISDGHQSIKDFYLNNTSTQTLVEIAKNFINANYPSSYYGENAMMNIEFLMYSNTGDFIRNYTSNGVNYPVVNSYDVTFQKYDVYITRVAICKFKKLSGQWVNIANY